MIDGDVIIQDLKNLLEGNTDLQSALGTIPDTSKIMVRNTPPQILQPPLILISDLTVEVQRQGQGDRNYFVSVDLIVVVSDLATEDRPDYKRIYLILNLIDQTIRGANLLVPMPFKGQTADLTYSRFDLVGTPSAIPYEGGSTAKQVTYRGVAQERINAS